MAFNTVGSDQGLHLGNKIHCRRQCRATGGEDKNGGDYSHLEVQSVAKLLDRFFKANGLSGKPRIEHSH